MTLTLLNGNIALADIKPFSGNQDVMCGTVAVRSAGITQIVAGDIVFYPARTGLEVRYNDKEYIIINQADALGKMTL